MNYYVTAIRDITVRAYIPNRPAYPGAPSRGDREQWINIKAGQTVQTGLVTGLHPKCVKEDEGFPIEINGIEVVLLPSYDSTTLPQDFYGALHLEYR